MCETLFRQLKNYFIFTGNEKRSRYKAQRRIVKTKTGESSLADSIQPTTGSPAVSPNAKSSSEKAKENSDDSFTEELQQLKKLLDQRRFELKDSKEQLGQGDASVPAHGNSSIDTFLIMAGNLMFQLRI